MGIFIIAEIGINHNGDLSITKELINLAKDAGCDAVKFQKRTLDLVYSPEFLASHRESPWGTTQRAQKEGLEFGLEHYRVIDAYCGELGIEWFASAWDIPSQRFLRQFDLKHNKVASAMITYKELLREIASEKKHTFISTGMCGFAEVDAAVEVFRNAQCSFELMHCVSTYPMDDEDANLRRIETLRNRYRCDVGYSGHETGLAVSYAAAALGATSLERHITLDRAMYGSDQAASIETHALSNFVETVRKIPLVLGTGEKTITAAEQAVRKKLRVDVPDR